MNPMIGSQQQQQQQNMSNGLDLGQQLQQQQQQGQSSALVAPSLQTPNTPTSIPEIIFTGKLGLQTRNDFLTNY